MIEMMGFAFALPAERAKGLKRRRSKWWVSLRSTHPTGFKVPDGAIFDQPKG